MTTNVVRLESAPSVPPLKRPCNILSSQNDDLLDEADSPSSEPDAA